MLAVGARAEQMTQAMRSLEAAFLIGVEGATEIWLVRHADCYEGMADGGDPPLSPLGRQQAERLAERVRRKAPAAFYSSPHRRAVETARKLATPHAASQSGAGLPTSGEVKDVHIDQRLVEMKLELGDAGELHFTEPAADVVERMRATIDEIAEAHPGQCVVVVGHAAAILAYLTHVLRLEAGQLRLLPYYTSVSIVRALGDRRMVGALADTAHLE